MEYNKENVERPKHYAGSTSMECIDAMELMLGNEGMVAFYLGNAFKYLWRWEAKGGIESLKKAEWYLLRIDTDYASAEYYEKYMKLHSMLAIALEKVEGEKC